MHEHGFNVEIIEPPIAEPTNLNAAATPYDRATALSFFKAQSVAEVVADGWIIAGDTVAALNRIVFGKPVDRADARRILAAIGGTTHEVITGVTLLDARSGARLIEHDVTLVTMRALSEQAIESYLDTGAWEGKAGAYGIQDHRDAFVTKIEGSFTNVVGFPMELVARMFEQWEAPIRRTT